jgi:hypothetical protein
MHDRPDGGRHETSADPLTELARLIGQSDPFADLKGRGSAHLDAAQDDTRAAPGWLARPSVPSDQTAYANDSYAEQAYSHRAPDPGHGAPGYDHDAPAADTYAHDDRYAHGHQSHDSAARYDDESYETQRHQAAGDNRYRVALPTAEYEGDGYHDDGHLPPRGEDDGVLRSGRRGGLLTIAAVLGLAVIGTAGAFGYRAFTGGSADSAPPVIKADPNPAKTTPAAPSADAQNKPFQERVAGPTAVQTERIVPREEPPVAQPVAPPGPVPMGSRAGLPVPPSMAVAPAVAPAGEPKRVRTVTIRQEPNPDTTQTTRPTSQTPPRAATPKQNAGAPLAIAPAAETPPTRTVARTVPPAAPVADGSYIVQVSAQKTEGEAQSSYRAMQAKYPAVLAGREASIRRADLGDKGVYYRAQIGPFANAAAANTFCDNLKAAGGQCIVQKN